jgi:nicotinamidase-related amidase
MIGKLSVKTSFLFGCVLQINERRNRMETSFQIEREKTVLVIIDVQEASVKAMDSKVVRNLIRNLLTLIAFAREMGIPMVITEQYPRGLGTTVPEIKQELPSLPPIEKVSFSCGHVDAFNERLDRTGRRVIVLTGMETHVCVLQTSAHLIQKGFEVHVVADAVCSRRKLDWEIGLQWMQKKGATISTTEIIAFQLLKEAGTEEFKRLSKLVK